MDYNTIAAQAKAQVDAYGTSVVITRKVPGTLDEAAGTISGAGTTTHTVKAVLGTKTKRGEGSGRDDGTLIQVSYVSFLIAAQGLSITPKAGDTVTHGGKVYVVDDAVPLFPGGTYLLHKLLCRV